MVVAEGREVLGALAEGTRYSAGVLGGALGLVLELLQVFVHLHGHHLELLDLLLRFLELEDGSVHHQERVAQGLSRCDPLLRRLLEHPG